MKNVIICADHNIGFKVVNYILNKACNEEYKVVSIYTTETNNKGFWKPIQNINNLNTLKVFKNNEQFFHDIKEKDIDYIFLISWKHLISNNIIKKVKIGIINLHYSLLPNLRGVYPVNNAILNGEDITGITYHFINENIDAGNIIMQQSFKIESDDSTDSLLKKLDSLAFKEFKKIWLGKIELKNRKKITNRECSAYYSREYFESTNQLDLYKEFTALELLNLIRSKTFKSKSSLYFIDEKNQKIFVSIKLTKEK